MKKILNAIFDNLFVFMTAGVLLTFSVILTIYLKPERKSNPTHQEILYRKDSLEMEYYKQLLDTSYNFNHSEIPDSESNTRVQPAGR